MNSTRPPPPIGAPPPYAFVARVYRRSLRPIVIACAIVAILWSFLWGISALMNIGGAGDLKPINITLGTLYLVIGFIELYGLYATFKSNIQLVRIYAMLSILAAVIVVAAESVRFSVYFTHKRKLIDDCTADVTGSLVTSYNGFWGGRHNTSIMSAAEAAEYCNNRWNRSVWSSIAWLVIATVLGWFFVTLTFSYYHQLLSPQQLAPSQAFAMNTYPPYNPQSGYQYPAPTGPPPQRDDFVPPYDPTKLPGYGEGEGYSQQQYAGGKVHPESSSEDVRLDPPRNTTAPRTQNE